MITAVLRTKKDLGPKATTAAFDTRWGDEAPLDALEARPVADDVR